LKESSEERGKLRGTANTETIDRILIVAETNNAEELRWHKSCYAKYTDNGKISRLRKSLDSSNKLSPPGPTASFQSLALSSKTLSTNWILCMFCQDEETPKNKHCVQ